MEERTGVFKFLDNPMTLQGYDPPIGEQVPDCTGTYTDLSPAKLSEYKGKVVILSFVTSLDTGTCDVETRRFNDEAKKLSNDIVVLTVSLDLPFAQKRWCGAAGVEHVIPISDYKDRSFSEHFGVLIKELKLAARSIFVIDRDGVLQYKQLVQEGSHEPEYGPILEAAKKLV